VFCRSHKILTLEQKVMALELYYKNNSTRTVGEAFGVSKDQIQKLVKCKADVLEEYSVNAPSHSWCIHRKIGNDEINELTWKWFQDATTRHVQVSRPLIQHQFISCFK